jgi:hypothetical protein
MACRERFGKGQGGKLMWGFKISVGNGSCEVDPSDSVRQGNYRRGPTHRTGLPPDKLRGYDDGNDRARVHWPRQSAVDSVRLPKSMNRGPDSTGLSRNHAALGSHRLCDEVVMDSPLMTSMFLSGSSEDLCVGSESSNMLCA